MHHPHESTPSCHNPFHGRNVGLALVTLILAGCLGGGDRADDPSSFTRHQATAAEKAKAQDALRFAVARLEADTRAHRDSVRAVDRNVAVLLRDPAAMQRPAARDSVVIMRRVIDSLRGVNVTLTRRRESISARYDSMRTNAELDRKVIANLKDRLGTLEEMVAERDSEILMLESRVDSLAESNRILADSNQRLVQLLADTTTRLWRMIDSASGRGAARPAVASALGQGTAASAYVMILPLEQARSRGLLDGAYRIREDKMRQAVRPIDIEVDTVIPLKFDVERFGTPGRFDLPGLGPEVWSIDSRHNELVIHDPERFWAGSRYLLLVPLTRR